MLCLHKHPNGVEGSNMIHQPEPPPLSFLWGPVLFFLVDNRRSHSKRFPNVSLRTRPSMMSHSSNFNGLRVRMGVHSGTPLNIERHVVTKRVTYDVDLLATVALVSETACGGQIVLTSQALADADSIAVSQLGHILHLGAHRLEAAPPANNTVDAADEDKEGEVFDIFMLVPHSLTGRVREYPPIKSVLQVSPSYFEAPSPDLLVICFASVHNMTALLSDLPGKAQTAHQLICNSVRRHLVRWNGYECEERDCNFLLAFHTPHSAIKWALNVQEELLELEWSPEVLSHPSCETCVLNGAVKFRGPRLNVGMSYGSVLKKVPSKLTGRADYFGPLLNHAARIKSKAAGGQVVVNSAVLAGLGSDVTEDSVEPLAFTVTSLGKFDMKGMQAPVELFLVTREESNLVMRSFPVAANRSSSKEREVAEEEEEEVGVRAASVASHNSDQRRSGSQNVSWGGQLGGSRDIAAAPSLMPTMLAGIRSNRIEPAKNNRARPGR
mmetsp:Transcript_28503/g.80429  ORF Transcript_28503/g.80429 Transcript_28503/m.80429 type:complete len:495 (-) Transcript_28503:268-1752(-)